jgi:hypothetical protein
MYFPYLIARNEEVEALVSTVCSYEDNKIVPILEPYNIDEDVVYSYQKLLKIVKCLVEKEKKFILMIESESDLDHLRSEIGNLDDFCIHGYKSSNNNYSTVTGNTKVALIHEEPMEAQFDENNIEYHIFMPSINRFQSYINQFDMQKTVLIEDGFISHKPNSEYPYRDFFNSELCFTYSSRGYIGFGDFTILEQGYEVSDGARANNISHVVHITRTLYNKVFVYHYLTTPMEEASIKERSKKTLRKAYADKDLFPNTLGIQLINEKKDIGTSLGMYKRIGIIHHIELIHMMLNEQ